MLEEHEVSFHWVKGHNGDIENERCDALATLGIRSAHKLIDTGYLSREERGKDEGMVLSEGHPCRKCGTVLCKRIPQKKALKAKASYYYEYYLYCVGCNTQYLIESAKRTIDKGASLF